MNSSFTTSPSSFKVNRFLFGVFLISVVSLYNLAHEQTVLQRQKERNTPQIFRLKSNERQQQQQQQQYEEYFGDDDIVIDPIQTDETAIHAKDLDLVPVVTTNDDTVCSIVSRSSSVTRLWKQHITAIVEAAKNPDMPEEYKTEEEWEHLRTIIEETLTPTRMRRSIQHLPSFSHHIVNRVMEILRKRIEDPKNNPPLRIAVFGGSVTLGRGCTPERMQHLQCAWPHRFQVLVNSFFGKDLIQVFNLAIGGTNSKTATNRIKYWMYGDATLSKIGPDVIINSYSTNDSTSPWDKTWPEDDLITIVRENVHNSMELFIREAFESKSCETPPLIIHVDDYLGPQQPALLGELSYVTEMNLLAKYYDTVGISYAEVVRDIAYHDQNESNFHNHKDVHYGRFAHTSIALSVAFASLQLLVNYCDDEYNKNLDLSALTSGEEEEKEEPKLITRESMKRDKLFLPPPLTKELLYANSEKEFETALDRSYRTYIENDCASYKKTDTDRNPCMIAWISTPGNYDSGAIQRFMKQHQKRIDGWQAERQNAEGWSNKDGWIANRANATFSLQFVATKAVKTVSIYFLRSYGEKWKDSNAKFTISRKLLIPTNETETTKQVLAEREIAGVHAADDYHYSLTLSETISLSEMVKIGETFDIDVDLLSGSHFKIMGLMICNK